MKCSNVGAFQLKEEYRRSKLVKQAKLAHVSESVLLVTLTRRLRTFDEALFLIRFFIEVVTNNYPLTTILTISVNTKVDDVANQHNLVIMAVNAMKIKI